MKIDIYNTDKKYNIIYADPPWHYRTWRDGNGTANRHYQTMKIEEIVAMKDTIQKISEKDCVLCLGHWTRANAEICLIATRGHIKRISNKVSQVVDAHIQEHSKKPDIVRDRIVELIGDLPRIELFARQTAEGWDCWGNEV